MRGRSRRPDLGAGPTGLAHALWLAPSGIRVRIIDNMVEPGTARARSASQPTDGYIGWADADVASLARYRARYMRT